MKSPEDIINLFKYAEIDKNWSFYDLKPSDTSKWTHGYHRYPAKFIPQLVEKLIDEYIGSRNAHINDPFMGSGTTIVSAISKGLKSSGTDINKLAFLLTKVKSTPIEPKYLSRKVSSFLKKIQYIGTPQKALFENPIIPLIPNRHIERIDYWFPEKNKKILGKILRIINDENDSQIKDFLLVGFSQILKNCSIWNQKSTKPTRDFKKTPANPYKVLKLHLYRMMRGNEKFYSIVPSKVRNNLNYYLNIKIDDARNQPVENSSVDLIISSSPYVTSYEYADLHQLSTIWFDLVDNLTLYRRQFIGTLYKEHNNKSPKSIISKRIIKHMLEKNKRLANEISVFFLDMEQVFNECYRILKPGGRCCFVIGNTVLKGIKILNAEVFTESLQYSGFVIDRIIKREIPSKILPQKRDKKTGRFTSSNNSDIEAYPVEYIIIGKKID
ncbi:MAG: DNA methyltransferase [Candidatus Helarchaeota archaeon]